jgi:hypothetical protein
MAGTGPWKLRAELLGHEQVARGVCRAFSDVGVLFFSKRGD